MSEASFSELGTAFQAAFEIMLAEVPVEKRYDCICATSQALARALNAQLSDDAAVVLIIGRGVGNNNIDMAETILGRGSTIVAATTATLQRMHNLAIKDGHPEVATQSLNELNMNVLSQLDPQLVGIVADPTPEPLDAGLRHTGKNLN